LLGAALLPDALRDDLRRWFVRGADLNLDAAGLRLAQALSATSLKLHPFDYPALREWITRSPVALDSHATRWVADDDDTNHFDDDIGADN
jgi:hypothetical protein